MGNRMTIKELLSDRANWAQHDYAYRADGEGCWGTDKNAVCWCLLGAVDKVYPGLEGAVKGKIGDAIRKLYPERVIGAADVNDELGYEAVMKVVEEAGV